MTARYIDQGGGRRSGSFAIYLEPWHTDIIEFLELRKNHGDEELRCRDLFLALWTPDLFMERVKSDGDWCLFCPDKCPGLSDAYGDDFKELYERYEQEGLAIKNMKARSLWFKVLDSQMETGTPYILYKDAANKKSNQKNLGTIKSSNLCCEINQYSSPEETAVCNLASISLTKMVEPLVKYTKAKIYSKAGCDYCTQAKILLKENGIYYEEVVMDDDKARKKFYQDLEEEHDTKVNSMPQIYLYEGKEEHYVGGYDSLTNKLKLAFNYDLLHSVTKIVTENLNNIIDINYYPTEKTKTSNMRHRPIGIGIQGLADVFFLLDIPFHSEEAKDMNKKIFETIYHGALEKSMELSKERSLELSKLQDHLISETNLISGGPINRIEQNVWNEMYYDKDMPHLGNEDLNNIYHKYKPTTWELLGNPSVVKEIRNKKLLGAYSSFETSPAAQGILQFDMWGVEPSLRYDWASLKQDIMEYGLRNSLLVAPMPTASTSQILGNNECFEPVTSNIYTRRTLAGEFVIANKYLMNDLIRLGKWNEEVKNNIISNQGSVQQLPFLSQHMKDKYKTVWEMPMKHLIDMSKERGAYICQSQSLNLWVEDPDYKTLTSMHFYSHQAGLKTGIYYLRRKARHQAQQFTIAPETINKSTSVTNDEICEMCSS
jgi:ribonucleotide reductase alpha subunit